MALSITITLQILYTYKQVQNTFCSGLKYMDDNLFNLIYRISEVLATRHEALATVLHHDFSCQAAIAAVLSALHSTRQFSTTRYCYVMVCRIFYLL